MLKGKTLKRIRIVIASVVLLWSTALFFDLHQWIPEEVFLPLRYLQFVPALQLAIAMAGGALIALGLMLVSALIFGRFYCSFLCPLGILQDVIAYLRRKLRKKSRYKKQKPHSAWRYSFLFLLIVFVLAGSGLLTGLLDPYSWFGRISQNIFQPPWILLNNSLAWILTSFGSYAISPVKFHGFSFPALLAAFSVLTLVTVMVWKNGRIYCNTVCPVGTTLGLLGKNALFRIRFEESACTSCGLCAVACKAGCIDMKSHRVDHSRCVLCFNCLPACDQGGISYATKRAAATDLGRRDLFVRAGTTIILPSVLKEPSEEAKLLAVRRATISPPGSVSHANLHIQCTACHLCISACPTGVLQPAFREYGLQGIFQPYMDPISGYCNYDCIRCLEVCPTGAIKTLSAEEKKAVQMGRTRFIKDLCVVTKDNTACGACSEHCPTKAVNMVPYKDALKIPQVDNTICIGCGACEYACPTNPRSIVVDGNPIHKIAEAPKNTGEKAAEAEMEEFPF